MKNYRLAIHLLSALLAGVALAACYDAVWADW